MTVAILPFHPRSIAEAAGPVVLLSSAEEADLARRRDSGDADARDELVRRNVPLALHVARPFLRCQHADRDDLISAALVGLVRAADGFDPGAGCRFSTYATVAILREIDRHSSNAAPMIRVGAGAFAAIRAARRGVRPPGWADASPEILDDARRALGCYPTGWNHPPDGHPLDAVPAPHEALADRLRDAEWLRRAMADLPRPLSEILRLRYGLDGAAPKTLRELAEAEGVTRTAIGSREKRAIRALRVALGE